MNGNVISKEIIALATDPIYIGTGGYTIGRVDNTIVRDPITKIPKIPGSSLAGTWRYYVALELQSSFKDDYKQKISERKDKSLEELFNNPKNWMSSFDGNRFARIKCAGQDETSYLEIDKLGIDEKENKTGHCGHCIVCKAFGFSKKDISNQGMLFFSDLNILFFPVYTRLGVRWVTSPKLLDKSIEIQENTILTFNGNEKNLNLGWLNLEVSGCFNVKHKDCFVIDIKTFGLKKEDIIIVHDNLISQIINSNLEVRTSVSIDPITGAAKEKALFTSEAIPRGTIFYGEVRGFKKEGVDNLPQLECVFEALDDTKKYFNTLGIGGMTTRGFGRLEVLSDLKNGECKE
ncbi:RAMP superfamily CRISPR-associated protein [Caminibacter pacificus]